MAGYEGGILSATPVTAAAYCTIRGATGQRVRIREIGISLVTAVASSIGLGHPANTPAATTSVLCQRKDPADVASITNLDTAWSTAPTPPTVFMRRIVLPATIGSGWVWTFPDDEPLIMDSTAGSNQQLVLWNFGGSTAGQLSVYVVTKE